MKFLNNYFDDVLFIVGFILILIGTYKILPIAAWFVGGLECLISGFLIAWGGKSNNNDSA